MAHPLTTSLISLAGALALAACGSDDEAPGATDARPGDAATADAAATDGAAIDAPLSIDAAMACPAGLNPAPDLSAGAPPTLIISEINPGEYIEVFNNTTAPMNLAATVFELCSRPGYARVATLTGAGTVPAGAYATLGWPVGFADVDAGGEVMLYASSSYGTSAHIMDFVCWGVNPHSSRKAQAVEVGKWTGDCAGALTSGAIHRLAGTTGTTAASYSTSLPPSAVTCTPAP